MQRVVHVFVLCAAAIRGDQSRSALRVAGTGSRDVLANLKQVLATRGEAGCADYVNSTLTSLAAAYTEVQVPPTLHQVCRQGTFFHIFPSQGACMNATDALIAEFDASRTYGPWCGEIATLVNATAAAPATTDAAPAGNASQPNA